MQQNHWKNISQNPVEYYPGWIFSWLNIFLTPKIYIRCNVYLEVCRQGEVDRQEVDRRSTDGEVAAAKKPEQLKASTGRLKKNQFRKPQM